MPAITGSNLYSGSNRKSRLLLLVLTWLLLLLAGCEKSPSSSPAGLYSIHFTFVTEVHSSTQTQSAATEVWQSGNRVRIERDDGTVVITVPPHEYRYKKGELQGTKVTRNRPSVASANPLEDTLRQVQEIKSGTLVGRETVDGVECERYEVEKSGRDVLSGRRKSILWYSVATQFPAKIVHQIPDAESTLIYRNVEINMDIPDSIFEPPQAVHFEHLDVP